MISKSVVTRVAVLAATAFIVACGGEVAVAPVPVVSGPGFEVGEADQVEDIVIWPSYELYQNVPGDESAGPSMSVQALAAQPNIRIGVIESAGTVYLGATAAWTMRDRATGGLIMTGNGTPAAVTLASVSETFMSLQVACGSVAAIAEWKARAEARGHLAYTQSIPLCTRLFIGRYPLGTSWGIRNNFRLLLVSQGLAPVNAFWPPSGITIGGGTVYRVTRGSLVVENVNPVTVASTDGGQVTIGASASSFRRYRGTADARINGGGTLAGVNELPMEQYLYGVVPRELGPIAYPEIEAQKAQAIAARTYAMRGLNKRFSDGYDLRATTSDQVYGGFQDEHPVSSAAIDATSGIVARFGGVLIDALYSSASGGHTSSNEEVFASGPVAYLRGVPDAQRGNSFEHVPTLEVFRAHANPTSLRNTGEGDFPSDWSSRHRWTFEWTADEISSVLSAWATYPVGRVVEINVTERGPSGRATTIQYVTEAGTLTHNRDGIRSSLRYLTASGVRTNLPSTLFFIEPVKEKGQMTGGFRVYGGGFGHGVGLSQTGAVGMAEKGRTYDEILKHYYTGISLDAAY